MTRIAWNKRTEEEVKKIVEKRGYVYIADYFPINGQRKVIVKDFEGYKYDVYLSHFLKNKISFVSKSNPFTVSHNIPLWLKLNNSQFELVDDNLEYGGAFSKLNFYCNNCEDYPSMSWDKIYQGRGCPICSGHQVGKHHNLQTQFPDIAKEWHPTLNGTLTPKDVTYGSTKKVYWLCQFGHKYFSHINNRTNIGSGCKICADSQKESKIATELKNYIKNKYQSQEEYSIFLNPETNHLLPYDIYIFGGKDPRINGIYIEIHGEQHYKINGWHKQLASKNGKNPEEEFEYQKHKDRLKRGFARKHGTYIEVDLRKIKTIEQAIEYLDKKL